MNNESRIAMLNQIEQLSNQLIMLNYKLETGYTDDETQDVKGDYQKDLNLIVRSCEMLQEDYKERFVNKNKNQIDDVIKNDLEKVYRKTYEVMLKKHPDQKETIQKMLDFKLKTIGVVDKK